MAKEDRASHYAPTLAVQQAVQDAQHLLAYAVESKLTIADDIITALVRAKNVLRQDVWNPDEEGCFWKAFTKLTACVKPVTVRSLKSVYPPPDCSFWQRIFVRSNIFLTIYAFMTLLVFVVVLCLQTYWFIGNTLLQDIETLTNQRMEMFRAEQALRGQHAETGGQGSGFFQTSETLAGIDRQLQTNYIGLLKWSTYWKLFLPDDTIFEGKNVLLNERLIGEELSRLQRSIDRDRGLLQNVAEIQKAAITQRINSNERERFRLNRDLQAEQLLYKTVITKLPSQFVLEMLQSYMLPMLYGLLGAAIYVLRTVTREIEQVTYCIGSDIRYELRLALGALGGLGIGWFLVPEDFSGLLRTLSPLALSLAVGYNIEVLFSLMDSFVDNWTKSNVIHP